MIFPRGGPLRSFATIHPAMDPLTHTLVGANLAATRLGRTTRLGAAALVVGANLPDVDAWFYFTGDSDFALGFRRGWTHGVLAIVVLPFILTGLLLLYDRLRPSTERGVNGKWLLALSAIGVLTHPFLDWLNTYGMRWLMPFDGRWSYGDSVFIMDPFLWVVLGGFWLAGRAPSRGLLAAWAFCSAAIAWVVAGRQTSYLIVVAVIALLLLGALLWRPRDAGRVSVRFATAALVVAALYIGGRLLIHHFTVVQARDQFVARQIVPSRILASPHPFDPFRWEIVAEAGRVYRYGTFHWSDRDLLLDDHSIPVAQESPLWEAARNDPSVEGFMTWVRFPWYEIRRTSEGTFVHIMDARRARRTTTGFGGVVVKVDEAKLR